MARIDPHSYTDPDQGAVRSIDLRLVVDFSMNQLRGTAVLHLERPASKLLDLDTRDLEIGSVRDGDGTALQWELGERDPVLGSRLRIYLDQPTDEIHLDYGTSPGATALQWLEPSQTAGKQHPYMFSQCQPHHARSMIPLQDSPRIRFAYTAQVTVPDPLVAVMSAAPGQRRAADRAGTSTIDFEMPQPIPSYLLAIAVGNLASRDLGPRSRVYTEPEMLDAAAWEFEGVDAMLTTAESLFGPYRWDRYDFLVMPPAFPYGGMENPRLTFLTPSLIAGDRSLVDVLAHELAHSWTGNLVTNATMDDFWLNEGFTVWAERRILEALQGEEALSLSAALGREDLAAAVLRFGADSPFTHLKTDLAGVDPDEVYSQVPYEKGSLFVALLERTVGRERWDAFIGEYMDHFQFQSITTEEFEEFLNQKLPGLAAETRAAEWIYGPGVPDNEPRFESPQLEALKALARGWDDGERPDPEQTAAWSVSEWLVYLGDLPAVLSESDCAWLDQTFGFSDSGNAEILCKWLLIAASAGYQPAYPKLAEFLGTYGRMKYLKPLYQALATRPETLPLAVEIFATNRDSYHPIARSGIERILDAAALAG